MRGRSRSPSTSDPTEAAGVTATDYADAIVERVDAAGFGRVVLVGHSLAGVSLPLAAQRLGDRVAHLLCFSAVLVPPSGNVMDLVGPPLWHVVRRAATQAARRPPSTFTLPPKIVRYYFCNGLSPSATSRVLTRTCPEPAGPLVQRIQEVALDPSVPRTYVGFREDRAVRPALQRRFAQTIGSPLITIDGGHDGMLSHPAAVAHLINWASRCSVISARPVSRA